MDLEKIHKEIEEWHSGDKDKLEEFRLKFISRKGVFGDLFSNIKNIPNEAKKEYGQKINVLKNAAQEKFQFLIEKVSDGKSDAGEYKDTDFTLPGSGTDIGNRHPLKIAQKDIVEIFQKIGFDLSEGPEIETDWYNFTALNFPENHPAREMQDTFFVEKDPDMVLRTHTSSVQIRVMESTKPPIRTLSPGRVYRNEAISARSHCVFYQAEGLYIDKNVSFKDLKQTMLYFAKEMFGKNTKIRLRPSYFPFTEPSAEMDVYWGLETEVDKKITKGTGWLEILGCGMVDPNVLENCNIDPKEYSGFAFGMGIERIALLKYQIPDIRLFTENDTRFLKQFKSLI